MADITVDRSLIKPNDLLLYKLNTESGKFYIGRYGSEISRGQYQECCFNNYATSFECPTDRIVPLNLLPEAKDRDWYIVYFASADPIITTDYSNITNAQHIHTWDYNAYSQTIEGLLSQPGSV